MLQVLEKRWGSSIFKKKNTKNPTMWAPTIVINVVMGGFMAENQWVSLDGPPRSWCAWKGAIRVSKIPALKKSESNRANSDAGFG